MELLRCDYVDSLLQEYVHKIRKVRQMLCFMSKVTFSPSHMADELRAVTMGAGLHSKQRVSQRVASQHKQYNCLPQLVLCIRFLPHHGAIADRSQKFLEADLLCEKGRLCGCGSTCQARCAWPPATQAYDVCAKMATRLLLLLQPSSSFHCACAPACECTGVRCRRCRCGHCQEWQAGICPQQGLRVSQRVGWRVGSPHQQRSVLPLCRRRDGIAACIYKLAR